MNCKLKLPVAKCTVEIPSLEHFEEAQIVYAISIVQNLARVCFITKRNQRCLCM